MMVKSKKQTLSILINFILRIVTVAYIDISWPAQTRIKIAERNINNLRYADDTTLLAESKEELRSVFMKMREESEKAGLKFNI